MMQGPAKERLKIISSNAECVSICGDKPTPQGYSFTCKTHEQFNALFFISKANVVITAKGSNLDCIMDQGKIRIIGITFSKGNNRELL